MDPIRYSKSLERLVTVWRNGECWRKYYRFRPARYYGGIATADAVGCNLDCAFCWVNKPRKNPSKCGEFFSPSMVAEKLVKLARAHGYSRVRVSGAEPTIGRNHLLSLLQEVDKDLLFILETNGILLGADKTYVEAISGFNIHVRVALKGCDREEFSKLTRADPEFFEYPFLAMEYMLDQKVSFHPAVMLFPTSNTENLVKQLREVEHSLPNKLEVESLILYPHVLRELRKRGFPTDSFG